MKRYLNLSVYRLIATVAILEFHILFLLLPRDIPYETLLSKGVQGLTVLSGFLYSQKAIESPKEFYKNNIKKLLIPAGLTILLMILWNLVAMFFMRDWHYLSLFFDHRVYDGALMVQPGNYYFIAYIFGCYLITPILQRNDKWSYLLMGGVFGAEIILSFFFGIPIIASCYFIGYFVGKLSFGKYVSLEEKPKRFRYLLWLGLTVFFLGIYILLHHFSFGGTYFLGHLQGLSLNLSSSFFGVTSFFLIILLLRFMNRVEGGRFFAFTDRFAYYLYLTNQCFMVGAMNVSLYSTVWAVRVLLVHVFSLAAAFLNYGAHRLLKRW